MLGGYRDGRLGGGDAPDVEGRLGLVAAGIVLIFAVFAVRLFQLQIVQGADLRHRSEINSVKTVRLDAPRGEIVDREGRVVASSRPAFALEVTPSELRAPEHAAAVLGSLLDRDPREILEALEAPQGRDRFRPLVLADDLSLERRVRIESVLYELPGVAIDVVPRRDYVEEQRAAHLLGTIGEIQREQLAAEGFGGYRSGEIVGQRGLERVLERHLRGRAGGRNTVVNVAGREMEVLEEVSPEPGGRVVLTLDLDLQRVAEEAFRAPETDPGVDPETGEPLPPEPDKMGALVALDPRNGDVLALVSRPAYDPNAFAGGIDTGTWRDLTGDTWRPLQDRALAGLYPPGSTYKAIVAAAGLAEGEVDLEEKVTCPGHYRLGRRVYRCWKRGGHGEVDLIGALRHSCDVFFYELGLRLGIDRIARYARGFGLGSPTGIDLPGEKAGLVPTREWKERARHEPWVRGETVSAAIGQGFNLVTPLQLAVVYAAIANGGVIVTPRTVLRLERWTGEVAETRPVRLGREVPVPDDVLETVRRGLTEVVMGERGTGARSRVPGLEVAGKTGTSQVVRLEHLEGLEEDEIPVRYRDHAWFAAFAPADAPEIVVAVLVEHGGSGGAVAAPMAQKVLARWHEKRQQGQQPEARVALD